MTAGTTQIYTRNTLVFRRHSVYRAKTSVVSHQTSGASRQNKLSFFAAKRKNVSVGVESGKSVKRLHKCKKIPQTIEMVRGLCYDSIQKERPVPGGELSPDGSVSICLTHILPTECLAAGVSFFVTEMRCFFRAPIMRPYLPHAHDQAPSGNP